MSPQEQDQAQRGGLIAVNRIVEDWLDLRAQVADAPAGAGDQQARSDPAAWSREDDSLLEAVDASARQRLSARQGSPEPGGSARPGPAPGR